MLIPLRLKQCLLFILLIALLVGGMLQAMKQPTDSNIKLSFSELKTVKSDRMILFFGFPQCGDMCPATLAKITQIQPQPSLMFIDIQPLPSKTVTEQYIQQFSPEFAAWTPTAQERLQLADIFPQEFPRTYGDRVEHQARLYVAEKNPSGWYLTRSFPSSVSPDEMYDHIYQ